MREIEQSLFQAGYEHESGIGWCYILVGERGLTLIDPGYGWHFRPQKGQQYQPEYVLATSEGFITSNLMDLLQFSVSVGKPITRCILSHSHADHVSNAELLIQRSQDINSYIGKTIIDIKIIAHKASPLRGTFLTRIFEETRLDIDGIQVLLIPTPGHSQEKDDLSIYLPAKRVLFCGDMCQPQGREYHICEGPSPIPFFVHGDMARKSLERLMSIDFRMLMTAHGFQYSYESGMKALELTDALLDKIDVLATKLVAEHPSVDHETLAIWIYDTITHERQFDRGMAEFRKVHFDRHGISDFQKFDKITIDFFLKKHSAVHHGSKRSDPF